MDRGYQRTLGLRQNVIQGNLTNVVWTGTGPTGIIFERFTATHIEDTVDVQILANYTNPGSGLTGVTFDHPAGLPAPVVPANGSDANAFEPRGSGAGVVANSAGTQGIAGTVLRRNAAASALEARTTWSSNSAKFLSLNYSYKTNARPT